MDFQSISLLFSSFFPRLFLYTSDDIEFACEEKQESWCGFEDRACASCAPHSISDSAWQRPADRVMSPQLGERIKKVAALVQKHIPNSKPHLESLRIN